MASIWINGRQVEPPYDCVDFPGCTLSEEMHVLLAPDIDLHLRDVGCAVDDLCVGSVSGAALSVLAFAIRQARFRLEKQPDGIAVCMGTRYFIRESVNAHGNQVRAYEFIPSIGVLKLEGRPRKGGERVIRTVAKSESLEFLNQLSQLVDYAIERGHAVEFRGAYAQ